MAASKVISGSTGNRKRGDAPKAMVITNASAMIARVGQYPPYQDVPAALHWAFAVTCVPERVQEGRDHPVDAHLLGGDAPGFPAGRREGSGIFQE